MKRLFIVALVALAVWFGWKKWPEFVNRRPGNDLVLINDSGEAIERLRVIVDGQTLVCERLERDKTAVIPFKVNHTSDLQLEFQWTTREGIMTWRGGMAPAGPMLQKQILRIDSEGQVTYSTENKLGS